MASNTVRSVVLVLRITEIRGVRLDCVDSDIEGRSTLLGLTYGSLAARIALHLVAANPESRMQSMLAQVQGWN